MMTGIDFFMWFGLMFPIAFSAGPNNLMCASAGAAYGIRRTVPFILGINSNIAFYSILAGFGLGTVLSGHPKFMFFLKLAGAGYILYLAFTFIRSGRIGEVENKKDCPGFWNGVVVNALNPKCF